MSRLKGGKSPGVCNIVPEMLKAGGEVAIEWFVKLFNPVWERVWPPEIGDQVSLYQFVRRAVG